MSFEIFDIYSSNFPINLKYDLHITLSKKWKEYKKALKGAHPNILSQPFCRWDCDTNFSNELLIFCAESNGDQQAFWNCK